MVPECPDRRLVDTLLEAGAKSDPGDAEVIADYLRVRFHRLRLTVPLSGRTKASPAVVRTRGDPATNAILTQYPTAAVLARILARAWVRVIWCRWQNTPYDPTLRGSTRQRLNQRVVA